MDALGLIMAAAANSSISNIQICSAHFRQFTAIFHNENGIKCDPATNSERVTNIPSGAKNIGVLTVKSSTGIESFRSISPVVPNNENDFSSYTRLELLSNLDRSFICTNSAMYDSAWHIKKDTTGNIYVRGYFNVKEIINQSIGIAETPVLFVLFYD